MIIAVISPWFSESMGYAENYLPSEFGKLGHESHLITSNLQIYGTNEVLYKTVYEKHLGPAMVNAGVFKKENYTLHRNLHGLEGGLHIKNLAEKLTSIKPDIVYCFEIMDLDYMTVIENKQKLNYAIFCESRLHASVFSYPKNITQRINQFKIRRKSAKLAKFVSTFYPIAPDVLQIITKYYGIPKRKCKLASLAVDVSKFKPTLNAEQKYNFRKKLGFEIGDVVCLYTGRFTDDKGPIILAKAIGELVNMGHKNFKALFVGQGDKYTIEAILVNKNCIIHPFVTADELVNFYNAMDIGVWPKQESTSQLDALACGMPIIISSNVKDKFRVEGCGLEFAADDYMLLSKQILKFKEVSIRERFGKIGCNKIQKDYSWSKLAENKLVDFIEARSINY